MCLPVRRAFTRASKEGLVNKYSDFIVTETTIQAILMEWALDEKHHQIVLPNPTQFFSWECDLISVTQASLVHEYEIKLNLADYKRDAAKRKHFWIGESENAPAYFWYVTCQFDIDPPEKAGWIHVRYDEKTCRWKIDIRKQAPRLNNWKISDRDRIDLARLLSYRLKNHYTRFLFMKKEIPQKALEIPANPL